MRKFINNYDSFLAELLNNPINSERVVEFLDENIVKFYATFVDTQQNDTYSKMEKYREIKSE